MDAPVCRTGHQDFRERSPAGYYTIKYQIHPVIFLSGYVFTGKAGACGCINTPLGPSDPSASAVKGGQERRIKIIVGTYVISSLLK